MKKYNRYDFLSRGLLSKKSKHNLESSMKFKLIGDVRQKGFIFSIYNIYNIAGFYQNKIKLN